MMANPAPATGQQEDVQDLNLPTFKTKALTRKETMIYLRIGTTKLWKICNREESDPTRIRPTSYGTFFIDELDRHLAAEVEACR